MANAVPFDFYSSYCTIMRKTYGAAVPLPSPADWHSMCQGPRHQPKGNCFDLETEQRDGWAYPLPESLTLHARTP